MTQFRSFVLWQVIFHCVTWTTTYVSIHLMSINRGIQVPDLDLPSSFQGSLGAHLPQSWVLLSPISWSWHACGSSNTRPPPPLPPHLPPPGPPPATASPVPMPPLLWQWLQALQPLSLRQSPTKRLKHCQPTLNRVMSQTRLPTCSLDVISTTPLGNLA